MKKVSSVSSVLTFGLPQTRLGRVQASLTLLSLLLRFSVFFVFSVFSVFFVGEAFAQKSMTVTISNALNYPRIEIVEMDAQKVIDKVGDDFTVADASGRFQAVQITHDGKLLFQAAVPAKGKVKYTIAEKQMKGYGLNTITTPIGQTTFEPQVFGKCFPERLDDVAWENDVVAFRTYGPALQKKGETAYGFDVWTKRTSNLVVQERYDLELDKEFHSVTNRLKQMGQYALIDDVYYAISYHVDHGTGMDCYKVGATLGAGTPALLDENGEIIYPWCWTSYEILDNGPLRFTVKLHYNGADGKDYGEERIISLDAGSQLNKCTVSYSQQPTANSQQPIAVGIVVHNENPTAYVLSEKNGYMGYEDLGDSKQYKERFREKLNKDFGRIYIGCVFPEGVDKMYYKEGQNLPGAVGHIMGVKEFKGSSGSLTYYFGSGWSRNNETDFETLADWEAYLSRYAECLNNPLKIK